MRAGDGRRRLRTAAAIKPPPKGVKEGREKDEEDALGHLRGRGGVASEGEEDGAVGERRRVCGEGSWAWALVLSLAATPAPSRSRPPRHGKTRYQSRKNWTL